MTAGLPPRWALYAIAILTGLGTATAAGAIGATGVSRLGAAAAFMCAFGLAAVLGHPHRVLGLVAPSLTAGTVVAAIGWATTEVPPAFLYVLVAASGCGVTALMIHYDHFWQPTPSGPEGAGGIAFLLAFFPGRYVATDLMRWSGPGDYLAATAVLFGVAVSVAWLRLFRPTFELTSEPVLWLMYRVRGAGPGLAAFPARGPCLVVANHACWFDPLFLAKVLPRPVTAMMTSRFYDVPGVRWLMRRFGTIRVPEQALKRDAAEVGEAVAALDRGECVVVFPEGFLRRSEDKPLKRFGRGAWHILQARPETPVFACWIEGGWGSYCSYKGGPPTKNKKPDFRRPIGVAVSGPVAVDAATLKDHLATRVFLMNRVLAARAHLDLPELPPVELPSAGVTNDE